MKPVIVLIVASPMTADLFLRHMVEPLQEELGARVHLVANCAVDPFRSPWPSPVHDIAIARGIEPAADLRALASLARLLRHLSPDLVHSVTPKAGLLGMGAAALCGVPVRLHTYCGQVWASRGGFMRTLLREADRTTARLATHLLADGFSQRDFLIGEGVVAPPRIDVLGRGSLRGVDSQRFRPDPEARAAVRRALGMGAQAPLLLYLGRLNEDKGIGVLIEAICPLLRERPDLNLLLAGPDEKGMLPTLRARLGADASRLHHEPWTDTPERLLAAADLLVHPSRREGFGMSVIEASACGVPTLCFDIYGLRDSVIEDVTGWRVPRQEAGALRSALAACIGDPERLRRVGGRAREHVRTHFAPEYLQREWITFYREKLDAGARRGAGRGRGGDA